MNIDVIIPTYKPGRLFLEAMDMLARQTHAPGKIIIVNTGARFFAEVMDEGEFLRKYPGSAVFHVGEAEFDHGRTRNFAVAQSAAEAFVMMTQDAVPFDEFLLENLARGLNGADKIAVCYGRQLPSMGSDELERFIRGFNYGDVALVKTEADVPRLGIKTYFCSNVCAVYRREVFDRLGGFANHVLFNEDMLYAAKALKSGYAIRYEPAAAVCHSHDYTYRQQFRRNFDNGASHALYSEVFAGLAPETEGRRLIQAAVRHLVRKGKPWLIAKLFWQSLAKYRGFRLGLRVQSLPRERVLKCTNNPTYWGEL
ncbi:MAG: glycosyltransferase [Lachnospiraceae bacterium]|jgi:rhamnosyltransferase|nr:glycosyltransferase [Lachnospiraceae bacterium]